MSGPKSLLRSGTLHVGFLIFFKMRGRVEIEFKFKTTCDGSKEEFEEKQD